MGEVNITENLKQVLARGYKGFVSFEWEKRWHPELPDPEIALPDFVTKIKKIVKS
jgi:predicted xylose isomerase-like sugar epimerase